MTECIQVTQRYDRWQADGYPSKREYNVTASSGKRIMSICNSYDDYNVYVYQEDGHMGLEILRNG